MRLRSHLVALVVVALLPLVLFSVIVVVLLARHEREATERGLQSTVRALAVAVDSMVGDSITTLRALATSEHLDTGDLRAFYRQCGRVLPSQETWSSVALVTPAGEQLLNVRRPFGAVLPALGDREYFREIVRSQHPGVSGHLVGRLSDEGNVAVAVPVVRERRVKYVLVAGMRLDALGALLAAQE
ncbi:MAG TPA: cache domain-containing protein, partial [Methylomirabilota bacterium]|nr:cache domain-containing protein [Methylomirabilota bacterium]